MDDPLVRSVPAVVPALVRREPPLVAEAVAATGSVVVDLSRALQARLAAGGRLRVCRGEGWLLVLGSADDLPWADGVIYLGHDDGLLLPTTRSVLPSADLVRRALRAVVPPGHDLLALVGDVVLASPVPARPLDDAAALTPAGP